MKHDDWNRVLNQYHLQEQLFLYYKGGKYLVTNIKCGWEGAVKYPNADMKLSLIREDDVDPSGENIIGLKEHRWEKLYPELSFYPCRSADFIVDD